MPRLLSIPVALGVALLALPAAAMTIHISDDVAYNLGYVGEGGADLVYSHTFSPDVAGPVTVYSTWLSVTVTEDPFCYGSSFSDCDFSDLWEPEAIELEVNGTLVDSGSVSWIDRFGGNISPVSGIGAAGDYAEIAVHATEGDAWVAHSRLVVVYGVDEKVDGEGILPAASAPEPSSAVVFALGTVLVARAARRNRR